jgi:hypothetical protein
MNSPNPTPIDQDADLSEQLILVQALCNVAAESEDAEIVRIAVSALLATQIGMTYLQAHPFKV